MVGVKADFSDVEAFFEQGTDEIRAAVDTIGDEADEYAREHGDYHDVTGRLRASNTHVTHENCDLELVNGMPYASFVEARGKDVRSGSALFAQKRLKDTFER